MKTKLILLLLTIVLYSCKKESEYKPIPDNKDVQETHDHAVEFSRKDVSDEVHQVVVKEIIPATKYLYLNVEENGERYWIAIIKKEIELGQTYYYNRALLKTNFESKETNRHFDEIYLVTNLVGADHAKINSEINSLEHLHEESESEDLPVTAKSEPAVMIERAGSIKIAELISNPEKFEGKTVQISGKCFKINPNIMERNWIHLRDGSKDSYDLVITSKEFVEEGSVVTMKGTVTLNKDFGAGYHYDLVIEDGEIVR